MPALLDPIFVYAAAYAIAGLFIKAALDKLRAFSVFRATLQDYALLPAGLVSPCAVLVVAIEAFIALGVFTSVGAKQALLLAVFVLLAYAAAIGINLLRGRRDIDCGCMGPAGRQSLSAWLVARNIGLAGVALLGSLATTERDFFLADYILLGLILTAAIGLYAAINQLMSNAPRLDALDSIMEVR